MVMVSGRERGYIFNQFEVVVGLQVRSACDWHFKNSTWDKYYFFTMFELYDLENSPVLTNLNVVNKIPAKRICAHKRNRHIPGSVMGSLCVYDVMECLRH